MAKEMMIIFVYDTELLQSEEDDPASAILYFHPGWVSDQQRTALCGQIIGTSHFLRTAFTCPRIFALQSGKFAIRTYGRYILAVGTDRNIADWVLEHRADTLTSLINFFHHDLGKLSELYQSSTNLSAKLYHMFETYLKILMYGGHMFFNIPTIQLPKSASHVFLEAMHMLQACQQINCVLGGTILYHNKVVATQLSSDLTKQLVLTDPYRIKSPAETFTTEFSLPLGVQLLQVYINHDDYNDLYEASSRCRFIPQYLNKLSVKKTSAKSIPLLSAMKRDQSLIFTTVPEEDADQHSPINLDSQIKDSKSPDRPKFLNLKNKTTDAKFEVKSEQPKSVIGQTSICSTPMTDLNKIVHQNIMSICTNPEETDLKECNFSQNFNKIEQMHSVNTTSLDILDSTNSSTICDKFHVPFLTDKNIFDNKKYASMWELREKLKVFNKRITMRYYNLGALNLNDLDLEIENVPKKITYQTISDPLFPMFKANGLAVSHYLYSQYLKQPLNFLDIDTKQEKKHFKTIESTKESPKKLNTKKSSPLKVLQKLVTPSAKEIRKGLSLPLKSLTSEQSENIFSPPSHSKACGGVQLTPLMSKLSLLAMEERSSGFCSRDTTPGDFKDARFTPSQSNYNFLRRKSSVSEDFASENMGKKINNLHQSVLFICGQQDMVMGLLLDEGVRSCPDVINQLWEICTESLGKLERQLCHCLETYQGGSGQNESAESYSYLCMDPQWDNVRRGGPWGATELGVLTHFHRDFSNTSNLTEIIVRNDESVVYGHHCGKTEVFYHQVVNSTAGLPTPADPMGTVSLKAKRRLERDHSIILL